MALSNENLSENQKLPWRQPRFASVSDRYLFFLIGKLLLDGRHIVQSHRSILHG